MNHDHEARFWDRMAPHHGHPDEGMQQALHDARLALGPNDRVLDVGCAAGTSSVALRPNVASVHGIDVSPARIKEAHQFAGDGLSFAATTLDDPALDGGGWTAITMFNVLHHLDVPVALARCHDLLPKDGLLLIEDSCFRDMPWLLRTFFTGLAKLLGMPRMHGHTARELEALVQDAGFEVETSRPRGDRYRTQWIVARKH